MARRRVLRYAWAILAEECAELAQVCAKELRFNDISHKKLIEEAGDVLAALDYARRREVIDNAMLRAIHLRRDTKLARLLDPNARDRKGRRLAP